MNGYYKVFKAFPNFLTHAVTLSFDDGKITDRTMIEILDKYGMKCTFNLNSGLLGESPERVAPEEVAELYRNHEVACHTLTHPHLNYLDNAGIVYQVMSDRMNLEDMTGKIVNGFAYPYGLRETPGMVQSIASCGIKYARVSKPSYKLELQYDHLRYQPTCHQADPRFDEFVEKFFAPEDLEHPWRMKLKLFYIWGHSIEYDNTWDKLEEQCKKLAGRDDVWYVTNKEFFDYMAAFDRLERSADGKHTYNPTDKYLYAYVRGKKVVFEPGKTYNLDREP